MQAIEIRTAPDRIEKLSVFTIDEAIEYWNLMVVLVIGCLCTMYLHGKPKEGYHDFRVSFVALLFGLPYIGKVFGWW